MTDAGTFKVRNQAGTVHLIIDLVGIYQDHHHDDRYYRKADVYTKDEVDQRAPKTSSLNVSGASFGPRTSTTEYSRALGQGGAYVTTGTSTAGSLVAPISLPHGATVTAVEVKYKDDSASQDLSVTVSCELLNSGSFSILGEFTTSDSAIKV